MKTENLGVKQLKNNKVFLREPPHDKNFNELFKFFWVQGIGNKLDKDGQPTPWGYSSLVDRFDDFNYQIDERTIQNWLAGNNKPNAKNLHKLARIVSNDSVGFKKQWRDAFTEAVTQKPSPKPHTEQEKIQAVANKLEPKSSKLKATRYIPIVLGAGVMFSLILAVFYSNQPSTKPEIEVTNLKFCDEARFDRTQKICTTNVSHFPAETSLIFVSFNMPNAPDGQPFERRWYREGQMFAAREGFADSAWEGYTWLQNKNGHDHGKYDLRIVVNGRATSSSFLLGEVNEDHEWP